MYLLARRAERIGLGALGFTGPGLHTPHDGPSWPLPER
ncbi:hypothetical protein HNR25_000419 [Streptomonospora salina]|uniref:Uncharacterized protein n=1 Tax=Streptomonospora salina TaxID=104205 RepID=A0A841E663_9ACTN|nr:hypothetical protein [Streptomonospora salina]